MRCRTRPPAISDKTCGTRDRECLVCWRRETELNRCCQRVLCPSCKLDKFRFYRHEKTTFFLVVDFLNHGFVSLAPQGWDRNRSNAEGWYLLVALALQRDSCSKWVYNVVRWGLIKSRVYIVCRLMMFYLSYEGVHIPFCCAQASRPMQQQLT
jgi:hypothetical protein